MVNKIIDWIKKEGLVILISIVLGITIINSAFIFYFREVVLDYDKVNSQTITLNSHIELMNKYVNLADLGLRGYIIEQDVQFLSPYNEAIEGYQTNLDTLKQLVYEIDFDESKYMTAETAIQQYMKLIQDLVGMCDEGRVDEVIATVKSDPGYEAWKIYSRFEWAILDHMKAIKAESDRKYQSMISNLFIFQVVFLLIGIPILVSSVKVIRKGRRFRFKLFKELEENNKNYLFDDGDGQKNLSENEVISGMINNLKKTSTFINKIATGDYSAKWEGLNDQNAEFNRENIAGELIQMRNQMIKVKFDDENRIWLSQGLSDFGGIIRQNQDDFYRLSEQIIINLVKRLKIQIGGLFITNENDQNDVHFELAACYAFDRVKSIEKKVPVNRGLLGQCYQEGQTLYMDKVPQDFVNITSGLGDTRPNYILLVPLLTNDSIEGVFELASLKPFTDNEIEFVEKLGENLATAIISVKSNANTKVLLEQTQQQAEEMRAQEEEMRQNMEELQATQEQMHRKNEEVENLLKQANESEELLKVQSQTLEQEKEKLEMEGAVLNALMKNTSDRITIKDGLGTYLMLSEAKYSTLREQGYKRMIGKSDKEVFGDEFYEKSYATEQKLIKAGRSVLNIEEEIQVTKDKSIIGLTSRIPFKGASGKVLGTLVITKDITKEKTFQQELEKLKGK